MYTKMLELSCIFNYSPETIHVTISETTSGGTQH